MAELSTLGSVIKTAYEGQSDTNAFTDTEKSKLGGIETGATADQTGAEIKTAYEGEADTNAFTDADHSKLDGIAASATANPNALDNLSEDATPQLGGDLDGQGNKISNFENDYNDQTGTTYTVVTGDRGKMVTLNNASAITVTLPNDMPKGWTATFMQTGAGQVTFAAGAGATLNNRSGELKIAGQHGMVTVACHTNSDDSSAVFILAGDTAA